MKNTKKILILLIIIVLTGCSANASVTVDEKGRVKEEVDVLIPSELISNKKDRIESYVNTAISSFKPVLKRRGYSTSIINNPSGKSGAHVYNSFDNICKYAENTIFSQYLYNNIKCTEEDEYYELKSTTDHIKYCSDCNDWPAIENVNLKITLPVKAEESDADEISGNTYVWKYDEHTEDGKTFYLKISKEKLKKSEKNLKNQTNFKNITFIVIIIVVIIVSALVIFSKLYKKYKNNNLEY